MTAPSSVNVNPRNLRIIAFLFQLAGVLSAAEMIAGPLIGRWSIELGILGWWIGRGLLRHERGWRTWAVGALYLGLVTSVLGLVVIGTTGAPVPFDVVGVVVGVIPSQGALPLVAGFLVLFLWQLGVLTSPEINRLFAPESEATPEPPSPQDPARNVVTN